MAASTAQRQSPSNLESPRTGEASLRNSRPLQPSSSFGSGIPQKSTPQTTSQRATFPFLSQPSSRLPFTVKRPDRNRAPLPSSRSSVDTKTAISTTKSATTTTTTTTTTAAPVIRAGSGSDGATRSLAPKVIPRRTNCAKRPRPPNDRPSSQTNPAPKEPLWKRFRMDDIPDPGANDSPTPPATTTTTPTPPAITTTTTTTTPIRSESGLDVGLPPPEHLQQSPLLSVVGGQSVVVGQEKPYSLMRADEHFRRVFGEHLKIREVDHLCTMLKEIKPEMRSEQLAHDLKQELGALTLKYLMFRNKNPNGPKATTPSLDALRKLYFTKARDPSHHCTIYQSYAKGQLINFHNQRIKASGDVFLCVECGDYHVCWENTCELASRGDKNEYRVCPASARTIGQIHGVPHPIVQHVYSLDGGAAMGDKKNGYVVHKAVNLSENHSELIVRATLPEGSYLEQAKEKSRLRSQQAQKNNKPQRNTFKSLTFDRLVGDPTTPHFSSDQTNSKKKSSRKGIRNVVKDFLFPLNRQQIIQEHVDERHRKAMQTVAQMWNDPALRAQMHLGDFMNAYLRECEQPILQMMAIHQQSPLVDMPLVKYFSHCVFYLCQIICKTDNVRDMDAHQKLEFNTTVSALLYRLRDGYTLPMCVETRSQRVEILGNISSRLCAASRAHLPCKHEILAIIPAHPILKRYLLPSECARHIYISSQFEPRPPKKRPPSGQASNPGRKPSVRAPSTLPNTGLRRTFSPSAAAAATKRRAGLFSSPGSAYNAQSAIFRYGNNSGTAAATSSGSGGADMTGCDVGGSSGNGRESFAYHRSSDTVANPSSYAQSTVDACTAALDTRNRNMYNHGRMRATDADGVPVMRNRDTINDALSETATGASSFAAPIRTYEKPIKQADIRIMKSLMSIVIDPENLRSREQMLAQTLGAHMDLNSCYTDPDD